MSTLDIVPFDADLCEMGEYHLQHTIICRRVYSKTRTRRVSPAEVTSKVLRVRFVVDAKPKLDESG